VKLGFEEGPQAAYNSGSQKARVLSETWAASQAFCPQCGAERLTRFENNRPVADLYCTQCNEQFELKSQKSLFGTRVADGAFRTMCERLDSKQNPNLMLMNYGPASVKNLFVVPKQFFVRDIIEERKPLAATARRAGWVGCNIMLSRVPEAGKIYIVREGLLLDKAAVLDAWQKTLFLRAQSAEAKGWLLNVLKCAEDIGKREFDLDEVYVFESRLSGLYPANRHVRQKIRQQLQVLRDQGLLEFLGRGRYRRVR
jgi:type II restriction enzyme